LSANAHSSIAISKAAAPGVSGLAKGLAGAALEGQGEALAGQPAVDQPSRPENHKERSIRRGQERDDLFLDQANSALRLRNELARKEAEIEQLRATLAAKPQQQQAAPAQPLQQAAPAQPQQAAHQQQPAPVQQKPKRQRGARKGQKKGRNNQFRPHIFRPNSRLNREAAIFLANVAAGRSHAGSGPMER
jgi:uncharacterized protein YfaS (alpha-2-macroglobulin family)